MKKGENKIYKIIAEILYLFLIFFFCYTAINKLMNIDSFRTNLIKTSLFTEEIANWFSFLVIFCEIVVVLVVIFYKKIGLLLLSFMILIFTVYISYLNYKGLYEVCGCGGVLNGLKYKYHLTINIFLLIGALFSSIIFNPISDEK